VVRALLGYTLADARRASARSGEVVSLLSSAVLCGRYWPADVFARSRPEAAAPHTRDRSLKDAQPVAPIGDARSLIPRHDLDWDLDAET